MKTILYITWDSDKTNYLESLFFPIFNGLKGNYQFVVYQFSWAAPEEVGRLRKLAEGKGIKFIHHPIPRAKGRLMGTLHALWKGRKTIKKLLDSKAIDAVMPRATMPAVLVNSLSSFLSSKSISIVFEADGLPIQERVDFSGLDKKSLQAKILWSQERKLVEKADLVLTRSRKSISYHLSKMEVPNPNKFFSVSNGRDADLFDFSETQRASIRKELGILPEEVCWVYVGSLGPAYALEEMLSVFDYVQERKSNHKFLILGNDFEYAFSHLKSKFPDRLLIKKIQFKEVPAYLSAADFGLSLRRPAPSLLGLFPIKLGEYLLCGLPLIASLNTGDAKEILGEADFVIPVELEKKDWLEGFYQKYVEARERDRKAIRSFALENFNLQDSINQYQKALDSLWEK